MFLLISFICFKQIRKILSTTFESCEEGCDDCSYLISEASWILIFLIIIYFCDLLKIDVFNQMVQQYNINEKFALKYKKNNFWSHW